MTDHSAPRLRAGIIGCGWFGRVHVERLALVHRVCVAAVCDPSRAAAEALALSAAAAVPADRDVQVYDDWEAMVDGADLDFAVVASPNPWHVRQLTGSLERGLHVLCEKPLSMDPAEVEAAISATRRSGKVVAIAYQSRYRRSARVLRGLIAGGVYGPVKSVSVYACEDWVRPNVGTWRHDPQKCPGGYFGDANGHQLDVTLWMTGMTATSVRAQTETRGTPVPMTTWGDARLHRDPVSSGLPAQHDGVPMSFMFVGDANHWREEIAVHCAEADFVVRNGALLWARPGGQLAEVADTDAPADTVGRTDVPDAAFVGAIRGTDVVLTPPETVWPVLQFTRAALASARSGGCEVAAA